MFEHEQLLVQHKEVCVMGWRRRSGNLIALRAEEAREETDLCSWPGLAPRRPRPCPTHTQRLQRQEIHGFIAATQDQT